ncbi:hypothetical protein ACOMHN_024461 [Nucella lapillus]
MWPTRVSIAESGPGCGPQGCPSQSQDLDVAHKGVHRRVRTWMTCMWPTRVSIAESGPGCGPQGCPSQSQDLDVAHTRIEDASAARAGKAKANATSGTTSTTIPVARGTRKVSKP